MACHTTIVNAGDGGDERHNPMEDMQEMFGPGHVDQTVRQTIQACWMALPKDRRTIEEVEKQIRRIVERALNDFREDAAAFGKTA
jgi:hypothetical protein